jgi:nitrate/TMAO reductase-like tetraheme cytochrome c subunit
VQVGQFLRLEVETQGRVALSPDEIRDTAPEAAAGQPAAATGTSDAKQTPPTKKARRRRRLVRVLVAVAALIVVLVGASFGAAEYTSRSSFCSGCHEMQPYYATWLSSEHSDAPCVDCHIPPGAIAFIKTKLFSLREIWVHVTQHWGTHPEPPLAVTREIPNSNCLKCHPAPPEVSIDSVAFSHRAHSDDSCLQCHTRLVHRGVGSLAYRDPQRMSFCLSCHDGGTAPGECSSCHNAPHEPRGECSSCHDLADWSSAGSRHPFPRLGAHAGLDCTDCHLSQAGVANIPGTNLAQANPACASCHEDQHGGLTDCASCHTPKAWSPSTFRHPRVGEHIPSGEHPLSCSSCHKSGFATASCTPCHKGTFGGDHD